MPKQKTNRSAAKRFSVTKRGKVKHRRAYARHHAWAKNRSQKRHLRHAAMVNPTEARILRRLMPYA